VAEGHGSSNPRRMWATMNYAIAEANPIAVASRSGPGPPEKGVVRRKSFVGR